MLKRSYKWPYSLLLPLGVLSLSINLYRVSNYLYIFINIVCTHIMWFISMHLVIFLKTSQAHTLCMRVYLLIFTLYKDSHTKQLR